MPPTEPPQKGSGRPSLFALATEGSPTPLTEPQRQLAERYTPMARVACLKFARRRRMDPIEFHGPAYLAICKAAAAYDPGHGVGFAAYARPWIYGSLCEHYLFLTRSTTLGTLDDDSEHVQLVGDTPETSIGYPVETVDEARWMVSQLSPRLRKVCQLMYLDGLSSQETARRLGYSPSYISRLHGELQARLKQMGEAA